LALFFGGAVAACDCGAMVLEDKSGGGSEDSGEAVDAGEPGDSGTEPDGGDVNDGGQTTDAGDLDGGQLPDGGLADGGCPVLSCTGLCGPVRDFCTGQVLQCGTCSSGLVCNLVTHVCLTPQINCAELGAACGQVKNSCGKRLNCGACPDAGQECDRNTHQCVPCTGATCADLGYQCGDAWLGCGPYSNTTNCGGCATGAVCNTALHICEPSVCSGSTDPQVCAASGAECGFITNGCGGLANCGSACDAGTSCGARGIGNRCAPPELPDECLAANRTCGTLVSACGGPALDCGSCVSPDVCGPDGNCHPPCTPRTCAAPELANRCGTGLDAGCLGSLSCPCQGALVCDATGAGVVGDCVTASGCSAFGATGASGAPCSNGASPLFPKGDGTNLACPCVGGGVCRGADGGVVGGADAGTCCVNTVACAANSCGVTLTNSCTGAAINCACTAANTHCNPTSHTCEADHTCATYGANGLATNPCSIGPAPDFPQNATTNLACACNGSGRCNVIGSATTQAPVNTKGECCFNTAICGANECNTTKTNTCTGATITCGCTTGGTHCNTTNNTCEANLTCASHSANGAQGDICSNGPSFSNGATPPALLTCRCATGPMVCVNGTTVVSGATQGNCCLNTTVCAPNTCNTTATNSCTGLVTNCVCTGNTYCDGNTPGVCLPNFTCADHVPPANGATGAPCSNSANPGFVRFPGDTVGQTCGCTGPGVCAVAAPSPHLAAAGEVGVCCTNTNPTCGNTCNTSVTDSCTGVVTPCNCGGGNYCNGTPGVCTPNLTCANHAPPASGALGDPCSTSANVEFPRYPTDATGQTCGCGGGRTCSVAGTPAHTAGPGEVGACCSNTAVCPANTCASITNTCTGATIACSCNAGSHCNSATTCAVNMTCGGYSANGAVGNPCSTVASAAFHDGPANANLTCPCSTAAGFANNTCVGSSAAVAGACTCTPTVPANCSQNGLSNGCGGTMVSTCTTGTQVCFANACCTKTVCAAGNAGDACGTVTKCGLTTTCPCTAAYQTCGAVTAGVCGCKPKGLADCGSLTGIQPDGCGSTYLCPG
jgi:hypothetical protein